MANNRRGRSTVSARRISGRTVKSKTDQIIEVATWFYIHGRTQAEIARGLGLDPSTISRYLKRAREENIVRVEIQPPRPEHVDLGRELAMRYGLQRAIVIPGEFSPGSLGRSAAQYVEALFRRGMRIGVSWGETLASMVRELQPGTISGLTVAQLGGGLGTTTPGIHGHELVQALAKLYPESRVHYLHAPAIVDSADIRNALLEDSTVRDALRAAARSEVALVGIGQMSPKATVFREGDLGPKDRSLLIAAGAVGNVNLRYLDSEGRPVSVLEDRTIAITWDELRAIPLVIAVAGGLDKVEAIQGALRSGCIHVVVTDEASAIRLLRDGNTRQYPRK